jgi:Flp pilus assembly protein TadG
MFLSLAIIDAGELLHFHQVINNAAREGARLSSQPENEGATTAIQNAVVQYAANNKVAISANNVTVDQAQPVALPDGSVMSSSLVTVTCSYTFQYLPKLAFFNVPGSVNLRASIQFRNLY